MRFKLEPRFEKCIILSFDEQAKAYRCYRPSTKQIFVSGDLLINETPWVSSNSTSASREDSSTLREDTKHHYTPAPTRIEELRALPDSQAQLPAVESLHVGESFQEDNSTLASPSMELPPPAQDDTPPSETNPPTPTSLSSPTPALNPLRCSERLRRFPRHLQEFAAQVHLESLDSTTGASLTTLLSNRPTSTLSGGRPWKPRSIRSTATTSGP